MSMVKRFVITHVNDDGLRRLTFAQQGRNTWETREEAQAALDVYIGTPGNLNFVLGGKMHTLEVREVDCYPGHFDPVRYYVED